MLNKEKLENFFTGKTMKILIFLINFLIIFGILLIAVIPEKYSIKVGDIAKVDIKAPRDVVDELSTKEKKEKAIKDIPNQYTIDSNVKNDTKKNIDTIFSKVMEKKSLIKSESDSEGKKSENAIKNKEIVEKLKSELSIKLSQEDIEKLLQITPKELDNLKDIIVKTLNKLYDEYQINAEIPEDTGAYLNKLETYDNKDTKNNKQINKKEIDKSKIKEDDRKKAAYFIEIELSKYDLNKNLKNLAKNISFSEIKPNVFYDEEKTRNLKEEELKAIEPIKIKKDQIIVKEGEPVTNYQVELLRQLGFLNDKNDFQWHIYLSLALLVALIIGVEGFYLHKYYRDIYEKDRLLILITIVNMLSIIFARTSYLVTPYLIPLAFAPMMLTLLMDHKLGIIMSIFNGIFISIAVNFNSSIIILTMLNAVIGCICLKKMDQRSDILYSCLYIAIINFFVTICLGKIQINNNFLDILNKSSCMFIASILSGIFTIGFLPLFESIFDVVTTVKLLELSNPNNPLLRRLLIEAPGTYYHSVLVANLAELAAEAIGANSVLARVSAYYHDVGKLKRPYFFRENQMNGPNPHDKIGPNLSTLIIISHVKDGIEFSKEYKIPKVIQDIIIQHHGTSLVKYFYITMKNNSEKPEDVLEEDFRYSGPDPLSKEAAIIMLADGVEAAVRSIREPDKRKIEDMVDNIIKSRLNEGHLDNCDLTLKDIGNIKKAFLKGLSGIYHDRIEYPKLINIDKAKNLKKQLER